VVEAAVARHGTVDALVNNVGITGLGTVKDVELDAFDSAVRVNLVSALLMTRAAAPALASGGGAIVNISSIAAIRTFGTVSYSTSKAALITLTQESAFTLGPDRVRANCILPGHMHASMSGAKHPEVRERRRLANVLATEGTAWDIAHAALFLASDEAAWITGVVLPVDGGTTNVTSLGMARLHEGGAV
jgi:NAD(P)-dependent dehydrogenase (short-subunit alcohol dehydrogenase family)